MTAGLPMMNCPSEENLAAFIDGRLDEAARRNIVEHMAQCAACRDTLLMADEIAEAGVVARGGAVVRGRFPNRMIAAAAAMAAAVVLVFLVPDVHDRVLGGGTGMRSLVSAAEDFKQRPSDGRLNSQFEYKNRPRRPRGGPGRTPGRTEETSDVLAKTKVQIVRERLEKRQATQDLSAPDLQVLGVAYLLLGEREKPVVTLEAAVKRATAESDVGRAIQSCEDVALLTDLVNAYLERGRDEDIQSARAAADRAWRLDPSALTAWNRAATIRRAPPEEEKKAWEDYLDLDRDPESLWAVEAQERIAELSPE